MQATAVAGTAILAASAPVGDKHAPETVRVKHAISTTRTHGAAVAVLSGPRRLTPRGDRRPHPSNLRAVHRHSRHGPQATRRHCTRTGRRGEVNANREQERACQRNGLTAVMRRVCRERGHGAELLLGDRAAQTSHTG